MKIAIIGTGISGLSCAYLLQHQHDVHVFESEAQIGGHTATKKVQLQGQDYDIDTGFIVYNEKTYPNFIRLMDELGVATQPTSMGFSVSCRRTGLEYAGNNLNTLFAQRSNLFNPGFITMIRDILRFNRDSVAALESGSLPADMTLGEYLQQQGYGQRFVDHYLVPMGSAIWSSTLQDMQDFPLMFFVRFFRNHGLLQVTERPQWRVICGGSKNYLAPLTRGFAHKIRTQIQIECVRREPEKVTLTFVDGRTETFDEVVFACHSDQALKLLADAQSDEQQILGAIPYRDNQVVLHTDQSILPRNRRTWSSWNYHLGQAADQPAALSYNMNILQGLTAPETFVVTLNAKQLLDESKILREFNYAHPVFTPQGIRAQQQWQSINGVRRTWFCGAYWFNGFHEDGCKSGIRVAQALGAKW